MRHARWDNNHISRAYVYLHASCRLCVTLTA